MGAFVGLVFCTLASDGCSSSTSSVPACTLTAPAQDDFCLAVAHYDERCGHCQDCTAKNLQNCTKTASAASDAYHAAFVACQDEAPCEVDPRFSNCVERQMINASPTTPQMQAKDAYCAACGATNRDDCTNFFSVNPVSGKNGAGYNILLYADSVATSAVTTCMTSCDPFKYGVCVALLSCGPSGGDFCADSGFCAAH